MAIGFTPKHEEEFTLDGLTKEQFLVLAIETANKMECEVGYISETGFIAYTHKGLFSVDAEMRLTLENGAATLKSASTGGELIDWGRNKKNIEKFIAAFDELKNTFTKTELDLKYKELKATFATDDELKLPPPSTTEKITGLFSIFTPTEGYFITPILLIINIVVFIIMVSSGVDIFLPSTESLINWGANYRPLTQNGELWRLVTCCFLHIGIIHLLFNMYALLYIGLLLEPLLGKLRFATAYMLTGIVASVASMWWHDNTVSAGASGAIFGMYGVFLAMLTTKVIDKSARKAFLTSIIFFVGYNLLNGLKGGIDNSAHIGGLVSGLVIGYAFCIGLKYHTDYKLNNYIIVSLIVFFVCGSYYVTQNTTLGVAAYAEKMQPFISMEATALEVLSLPAGTLDRKVLEELDKGIYKWNKCINLVQEVDKLNLTAELHNKNEQLLKYCELRIKCYNLLYKRTKEHTDKYNDSLEIYNTNIAEVINSLNGGAPQQQQENPVTLPDSLGENYKKDEKH